MNKKNRKSGSSGKGNTRSTTSTAFVIEEPSSVQKDENIQDGKLLSPGDRKLQRALEKQRRDEEEEKQRRAEAAKVDKKPKLEKKKTKKNDGKNTSTEKDEIEPQIDDASASYTKHTVLCKFSYTKLNYKEVETSAQSTSKFKVEKTVTEVFLTDDSNDKESRWWNQTQQAHGNDKNNSKDQKKGTRNLSRDREKREYSPKRSSYPSRRNDNFERFDSRSNQSSITYKHDDGRSSQKNKYSDNPNYRDPNQSKYESYDKNRSNRSYNRYDKYDNDYQQNENFDDFYKKLDKNIIKTNKVKEISGDLFTAPQEYSLGHCVAEDFSMGAGIALQFRKEFKGLGELLDQKVKTGGVAVLEVKGRYVYYLVTKKLSQGKPTLKTLWMSLVEMKKHMIQNKVTKLAIPQIGCGLDRLDWGNVQQMLEYVFEDVEVEIDVYSLDFGQTLPDSQTTSKAKKAIKTHVPYPLIDIESSTGLIYFGTVDSYVTDDMRSLDTKYTGLIAHYEKEPKSVGDVIRYEIRGKDVIYGFIWKRNTRDYISFVDFERCCYNLKKLNVKDIYYYFGFDAPITHSFILSKLLNVMQSVLFETNIYICWPENIRDYMPNLNFEKYS